MISTRHISAYVNHNNGFKVLESSTREFSIAKHLYKTNDISAAYNIGRVLAHRCKDTGIYRLMWDNKRKTAKVSGLGAMYQMKAFDIHTYTLGLRNSSVAGKSFS